MRCLSIAMLLEEGRLDLLSLLLYGLVWQSTRPDRSFTDGDRQERQRTEITLKTCKNMKLFQSKKNENKLKNRVVSQKRCGLQMQSKNLHSRCVSENSKDRCWSAAGSAPGCAARYLCLAPLPRRYCAVLAHRRSCNTRVNAAAQRPRELPARLEQMTSPGDEQRGAIMKLLRRPRRSSRMCAGGPYREPQALLGLRP